MNARMAAAWAAASATALALDLIWLGILAQPLYRREVGHLMAERAAWGPALAFYALYGWGLWHFAVRGALSGGGLKEAALQGALLGLLVYGTYDLTNMAVLKSWSLKIALLDIGWGVVLTAAACAAAFSAARRL